MVYIRTDPCFIRLSTLTDLGAPAPTPGAGYLGLFGLALGAAALRLRERFAR